MWFIYKPLLKNNLLGMPPLLHFCSNSLYASGSNFLSVEVDIELKRISSISFQLRVMLMRSYHLWLNNEQDIGTMKLKNAPTAIVWKRAFILGFLKSFDFFSKEFIITGVTSIPGAAIAMRDTTTWLIPFAAATYMNKIKMIKLFLLLYSNTVFYSFLIYFKVSQYVKSKGSRLIFLQS